MLLIAASKNVIDVVRSSIKLPEAYRAGRIGPALAQVVTAAPTTHLIDPNAPRVATAASLGRSYTKVDELLFRSASMIGVGLGAFQLGNGLPNVYRAVRHGGADAIVNTRLGREGALQTVGGGLTLGMFSRASAAARAAGVRGTVPVALAAAGSASLAAPWVLGTTLGTSALVVANDNGFLDFMNQGEQRTFRQVQRDSWRQADVPAKLQRARSSVREHASDAGQAVVTGASDASRAVKVLAGDGREVAAQAATRLLPG